MVAPCPDHLPAVPDIRDFQDSSDYNGMMNKFRIVTLLLFLLTWHGDAEADLWTAAAEGNPSRIKEHVASGASINDLHTESGLSALILAIKSNHIESTKLLLELGADINRLSKVGNSPLKYAAQHADPEIVEYLIANGAKIEAFDGDGVPPLTIASLDGRIEIVRLLLKHGANPNTASVHGWTPVHFAAEHDQGKSIEVLCKAGANPSQWNRGDYTPLMIAAHNGSLKAARALLQAGAHPSESNGDVSAITAAMSHRNYDVALLLAESGANLRDNGFTGAPLAYAVNAGQYELAKRLIDLGAPVPRIGSGLFGAAKRKHTKCVELLTQHGALLHKKDWEKTIKQVKDNSDVRSLIAIVRADRLQGVTDQAKQQAILARLEPAFQLLQAAHDGRTDDVESRIESVLRHEPWAIADAEQFADLEGQIDTIRLLQQPARKARRQIELAPSRLRTMTWAVEKGDLKGFEASLKLGADPNYGDPNKSSLMEEAIERKQTDMVRLLLEYGADPNRDPGRNNRTPLEQAAYRGTPEMVKLLLEAGADPDAGADNVPLYYAAGNGDTAKIKLLLDQGADIDLPGFEDRTALMNAADKGHEDAIELLIKRGAKKDLRDSFGRTAMQIASGNNHVDVVTLLIRLGASAPDDADGLRPKIGYADLNKPDRLKELLKSGADPNAKSIVEFGGAMTPLQYILGGDRIRYESVKLLVDGGADLSIVQGPLAKIERMDIKTLNYLIKAGADVNAADPMWLGGIRPIQAAAATGRFEHMKLLLDAGADPDLRSARENLTLVQVINGYPHLHALTRKERLKEAQDVLEAWHKEQAEKE